MLDINYVSLFSGIEAFSVAASRIECVRWHPIFFSEIEPFPCAVLAHHFPAVPNLGDIRNIRVDREKGTITNGTATIPLPGTGIDILAGGSPCQDVSIAGKRAGMSEGSGTRSSLAFEYARLVEELRPRVVVWENVHGVLSSNGGRDFLAFQRSLVERGYSLAYRVLDAQYARVDGYPLAVPQRRRRVWLVGCLGTDESVPAQILFERTSLLGDTPPRRAQGQDPASPPGYRVAEHDRVVGCAEGVVAGDSGSDVAAPLCAADGKGKNGMDICGKVAVVPLHGGKAGQDQRSVLVESASFVSADHKASCDGGDVSNTLPSTTGGFKPGAVAVAHPSVCKTLSAEGFDGMPDIQKGNGMPVIAIDMDKCKPSRADKDREGGTGLGVSEDDVAYTLQAREGPSKQNAIAVRTAQTGANGCGISAEAAHTIDLASGKAVAIGFCPEESAKTRSVGAHEEASPTLNTASTRAVAIGFKPGQSGREDTGSLGARMEECPTLPRDPGGMGVGVAIAPQYIVRRLTPTECERLQGFPDGWTRITYRGKPADQCPDSPRYKALGNSFATNCAEWVLRRIVAAIRLGIVDMEASA